MTDYTSQTKLVFAHLNKGKELTSFEAFEEYGITRLSAAIYILRNNGLDIRDKWVYCINRYGKYVKYKAYYLVKKEAK